jgi:transcriptional regulator with XRE-family HTH domain
MIKQKLLEKRKAKGKSQEDMAYEMKISQSQYSRRENGQVAITPEEWEEIAKILQTPLEEIFQQEESMVFNCDNQSVGIVNGTNNIYTVPEFLLDNQQKYILKLEEENKKLIEKIALLEEQVGK